MILDTTNLFPEGTYDFTVSAVPESKDIKGYVAWQWSFDTDTEEGIQIYSERFMVWLLAPLLRGLGFEEIKPGRFNFEPTEALGRHVTATIKHVTLEKGASAGTVVARMVDIKPIKGAKQDLHRAAMAAQAPAGKDDIPF